jgi:hypothetical protein
LWCVGSGELVLDAFPLKIIFDLKVLEFRSIVAPYLFSLLAQIHFELSLRSALRFLGSQIYPAKRKPK